MKLIFAGTPEFSAQALRALLAAGHQVELVLTQPDRPSGRGMLLHASPVKALAEASGIAIFQPQTLRDAVAQERIKAVGAEAMIVAAYGLLLPQAVLDMPSLGCLNIHASLLPRWRGAAPIQRAILAGDTHTGVCIMQMEAGLDTGPVLLSRALPISAKETAGSLHEKLATLGAQLVVETLECLPLTPRPQPAEGVCYAAKIDKQEAQVNWKFPASQLDRQIRAYNPYPGATACLEGNTLKLWSAKVENASSQGAPGTILAADKNGILVACGEGALRLTELQKSGGKRLPVAQFVAGSKMHLGSAFDLAL